MYADVQKDQRDQRIIDHIGLVKRIAYHLATRLPANVQVDDLIQAGMLGLIEPRATTIPPRVQVLKPMPVSAYGVPCWMMCVMRTGHPVHCTARCARCAK